MAKKKGVLKKVLLGVGIGLTVLTTAGLITHIATRDKDDDVDSVSVKYTIGVLAEDGSIDTDTKTSLISDFVEVENLLVDIPDEDSNVTFKIHYYNSDKELVTSTDVYTSDFTQGEIGDNIKYARIELIPVEEDVQLNVFNKGFYTFRVDVGYSK